MEFLGLMFGSDFGGQSLQAFSPFRSHSGFLVLERTFTTNHKRRQEPAEAADSAFNLVCVALFFDLFIGNSKLCRITEVGGSAGWHLPAFPCHTGSKSVATARQFRSTERQGMCASHSAKRFVILQCTYGPPPTICGCSPACLGTAHSCFARETGPEPVRFRKASQVLVHGHLALGTRATKAAGRLPDHDG